MIPGSALAYELHCRMNCIDLAEGTHFVRLVWRVPSGDEARIFRAPISARARLAEPSRFLARFLSSSAVSRTASFSSLSCCTTVPSRDTPAKIPGERDQEMISASIRMSVSAMLFGHGNRSPMVGWSGRCRVGAIYRRECRIDISTPVLQAAMGNAVSCCTGCGSGSLKISSNSDRTRRYLWHSEQPQLPRSVEWPIKYSSCSRMTSFSSAGSGTLARLSALCSAGAVFVPTSSA